MMIKTKPPVNRSPKLIMRNLLNSWRPKATAIETPVSTQEYLENLRKDWNDVVKTYHDHKVDGHHPINIIDWPILREIMMQVIQNHSEKNKDPLQLLDVGVGTGWLLQKFFEDDYFAKQMQTIEFTGYDLSDEMVKKAQEIYAKNTNIYLFYADAAEVTLPEQNYDLITSINTIDCIPDGRIEIAIQKMYDSLKDDGTAIVEIRHPKRNAYYLTGKAEETYNEGPYRETWDGLEDGHGIVRYYRHTQTWIDLFVNANFNIIQMLEPRPDPALQNSVDPGIQELYTRYTQPERFGALVFVLKKINKG